MEEERHSQEFLQQQQQQSTKFLPRYILTNIQVGQMGGKQFYILYVCVNCHILVWFVESLENVKLTCCEKMFIKGMAFIENIKMCVIITDG